MKKYLLALLMLCPLLFVQNASAKIKIYVQATTAPYLYAWNGNGDAVNGGWPGTVMTEKETVNEKEFWVKEFDLDAVNIIFNNGSGSQTADITGITSDAYFTYNGANVYENITAQITGQEETHTWGVIGFGPDPNTSDWTNDIPMTDAGDGEWTVTIEDVVVSADDLEWEYKVRQDGQWVNYYPGNGEPNQKLTFQNAGTYDVTISYNSVYNDLSETVTPKGGDDPQLTTYTIILNTNRQLPTDDAGDLAYAYVWTQGDVFVEQLGEWPGTRMTNNGPTTYNGQNGTSYVITFDAAVAPEMVIFHDNNGNQTDDFSLVFDESNIAQFYMFEEEEEQPETYAIVGDFWTVMDGETLVVDGWEDDHDMTQSPDNENVYTLVYEGYVTPGPCTKAYKLRANHKWHVYDLPEDGNYEYEFTEEGTFTLTFTANVEEHTLTLVAEKQEEPQPETVYTVAGQPADLFGTEWDESNPANDMAIDAETGLYTLAFTDVTFDADADVQFKVVENHSWEVCYPDKNYAVYLAAGTYSNITITFDAETKEVNFNAEKQAVAQNFTVVYLNENDWEDVYAYVWSGEGENKVLGDWPGTKMDKMQTEMKTRRLAPADHDAYIIHFPAEVAPENVIFNNGKEGDELQQTADIPLAFNSEGAFAYPESEPEAVYTVAGSSDAILGTAWDPTNTANDMVLDTEDGLYKLAINGVKYDENTEVEFKVVENHSWNVAYPENNYSATLLAGVTYNLTFVFNPESKEVWLTRNVVAIDFAEGDVFTVAGSYDILGSSWDIDDTNNDMTYNTETGLYELVKENVDLDAVDADYSTYMFKVVRNHSWDINWGVKDEAHPNGFDGDNVTIVVDEAATYNITYTFNPETWEVGYVLTKVGDEPQPAVYTVAGTPDLFAGASWDATSCVMTLNDQTGLYEYTLTNVKLNATQLFEDDTYMFKVVKNAGQADETWYPEDVAQQGDANVHIDVPTSGLYNVTFTFNPENNKVAYSLDLIGARHTMVFVNLSGWTKVYAYGYTVDDAAAVEFNGIWPGENAEWVGKYSAYGNEYDTYTVSYYGDAPEFVIFHNNEGQQTIELPFNEENIPYAYGNDATVILLNDSWYQWKPEADFTVPQGVQGVPVLVSYTRGFTAGQRGTVVLPFDLTAEEAAAAGKFYQVSEVKAGEVHIYEVSTVKAYTPYIFEAASEYPFEYRSVATLPKYDHHDVALGDKGWFMYEEVEDEVTTDAEWAYFGWKDDSGEFFKAAPGTVLPWRGFLKIKADEAPEAKLVVVLDDVTGIRTIEALPEGAVIYNMQGMRVQKATRGLYIVNGKKVVIK